MVTTVAELALEQKRTSITSIGKYNLLVHEIDVVEVLASVNAGKTIRAFVPLIVVDETLWFATKSLSAAFRLDARTWLAGARDNEHNNLLRFTVNLSNRCKQAKNYNNMMYYRFADIGYIMDNAPNNEVKKTLLALIDKLGPIEAELARKGVVTDEEPHTRSAGSQLSRATIDKMYKEAQVYEVKLRRTHKEAKAKAKADAEAAKQAAEQQELAEIVDQPDEQVSSNPLEIAVDNQNKIKTLEDMVLEQGESISALHTAINELAKRLPKDKPIEPTDIPGHPDTLTLSMRQLRGLLKAE